MEDLKEIAQMYKALGDETRLQIIKMLSESEKCVCEVFDSLDMSQPAVSHHLKVLRQAKLIKDRKEGKWIYYSLNLNLFEDLHFGESSDILTAYLEPIRQQIQKINPQRSQSCKS